MRYDEAGRLQFRRVEGPLERVLERFEYDALGRVETQTIMRACQSRRSTSTRSRRAPTSIRSAPNPHRSSRHATANGSGGRVGNPKRLSAPSGAFAHRRVFSHRRADGAGKA